MRAILDSEFDYERVICRSVVESVERPSTALSILAGRHR
jgi:hypothetical protein